MRGRGEVAKEGRGWSRGERFQGGNSLQGDLSLLLFFLLNFLIICSWNAPPRLPFPSEIQVLMDKLKAQQGVQDVYIGRQANESKIASQVRTCVRACVCVCVYICE